MRHLLAFLLATTFAWAELKIEDPAPATRPQTMIKGEAIKEFKSGEVYIFECWATWCGPCVGAIPHLNDLHQKMQSKGVTIVGVNVWDAEKDAQAAKRAREFVEKQGDKMSYRVAIGGNDFIKDWLDAAGVNGIPHAFIVKDGKIKWMGHPMAMNAELIGNIITGAAIPNILHATAVDEEMAKAQAKLDKVSEAMVQLVKAAAGKTLNPDDQVVKDAIKAVNEGVAIMPPKEGKEMGDALLADIALICGDPSKRYAIFSKLAEEEKDDAETQNEIAWRLITEDRLLKKPNFELAEACALRAVKLSQEKEGDKLDTLARLRWLQNRKTEAVTLQGKAVDAAAGTDMQAELLKTLEAMRKGELPKAETTEDALGQ
jgi:thiol-disulfide isomerase/thioredoxin